LKSPRPGACMAGMAAGNADRSTARSVGVMCRMTAMSAGGSIRVTSAIPRFSRKPTVETRRVVSRQGQRTPGTHPSGHRDLVGCVGLRRASCGRLHEWVHGAGPTAGGDHPSGLKPLGGEPRRAHPSPSATPPPSLPTGATRATVRVRAGRWTVAPTQRLGLDRACQSSTPQTAEPPSQASVTAGLRPVG